MNWRDSVKTLVALTLGTLLSLGNVAAYAAGTVGATPTKELPAGIEVIVVTAKRPSAPPSAAAEPIYEVIVTGKRATHSSTNRTPPVIAPVIAVDMPKLELAFADSVVRL